MAGRPAKALQRHVREGTFRARREAHRALLLGPDLEWPFFASLQGRYRRAGSEPERRALALQFEQSVREAHAEAAGGSGGEEAEALAVELGELGRRGSALAITRFIEGYLTHPKGPMIGEPFLLEPWQRAFLREFYRRDKQGRRLYRSGVLGIPRGNGKTPLAAALGLYELLTRTDNPEVYCAAGSKEQARIALDFARSFVENGRLNDWIRVSNSSLRTQARPGVMQVISSEGRYQHGRSPTLAIIDELWAFETAREEQTYTALSSALHKRDDAYLLAISTAGYEQDSLLGRIYSDALTWADITVSKSGCLTVARELEFGRLLWWYGAPEDCDLADERIWRACNPASWLHLRELKRQLHDPALGELEFRRLHLNQWTATRDAWLPTNCWRDLQTDFEIPERGQVYLGVDVGLYHDSTAVAWAHVTPEGRIHLQAHVWSAYPDTKAHTHCPDGKVSLEQVELFIRELAKRYRIKEVAYDPRYFDRSAEILSKQGLTMVEFLQASAPMANAYQAFYQAALEGRLSHNGDPILTAHVEGAAADKTERGWKVRKLKNRNRIDALIASILAHARAAAPKPGTPDILWL